ncbi:MAG: CRTAC1 family protein [Planctomycetota bacterium]
MSSRPDKGDGEFEIESLPTPEEEARARRTARVAALLALVLVVGLAAVLAIVYWPEEKQEKEVVYDTQAPQAATGAGAEMPALPFREAAAELGIDFVHTNGARGRKLLPETMGSGVCAFDADGDGDPDLLFVNGAPWSDDEGGAPAPTQRFYRNEGGRFVDATAGSGLDVAMYGMGVTAGDVDGDGRPDLFITAVGQNRLFRNVDGRRFEDWTEKAGLLGDERWSSSCAFLDGDRDGDLDLVVLNYVVWSAAIDMEQGFQLTGLGRAYGPPKSFEGEVVQYLRNEGGRFVDGTEEAGFRVLNSATGVPVAKSLGICVCDWNLDGLPDVMVANDTVRNFAFENQGGGRFAEKGGEIGVAFDTGGNARGAMGIDAAWWANDDRLAVAIGNFSQETTAFYVNEDPQFPVFNDIAAGVGIGAATRDSLTFGVLFLDCDLDGRQDLLAVNGHVEPDIHSVLESQHHAQPLELFWNSGPEGRWRFEEVPAEKAGPDLLRPFVGRGVATLDFDGDGDLDIVATENAGRARLFVNETKGGRALRLDLRDAKGRVAWGARVEVASSAGRQQRFLGAGHSYLSQSEPVLTFGLGAAESSGEITIHWPDGKTETRPGLPAGRHVLGE